MEFKELQKKNEGDLQALLAKEREKLRVERFRDANKQLKNVRELRNLKKEIARILTLINVKKK